MGWLVEGVGCIDAEFQCTGTLSLVERDSHPISRRGASIVTRLQPSFQLPSEQHQDAGKDQLQTVF